MMSKKENIPIHEQELFDEYSEGSEIVLVLRSQTKIDTGRWYRRSSLWLGVSSDVLILAAVGTRRYAQSVPLNECSESYYCHATGELVLEPVDTLTFKRLKMMPANALAVLTATGIDIGDQSEWLSLPGETG